MKKVILPIRWAAILLSVALALTACGEQYDTSTPEGMGWKIYKTGLGGNESCRECHTIDGTELTGPTFLGLYERAGTRIEGMSAEEYIRQSIYEPTTFIVEGYEDKMPGGYNEFLSDEDIDHLTAFIKSLE